MSRTSWSSVATVNFPAIARILASSWCPDKDLLVVILRVGERDRLSLWPMRGAKIWEVEIERESASTQDIVDIAWSPDGQYIAVAHNPPLVTLHSLQNGFQERSLAMAARASLSSIWWFKKEKSKKEGAIPDILRRKDDITGSAHSVLKSQPLLDPLHDESQPLGAAELFIFQGSHLRTAAKSSTPEVIATWPSLPPDLLSASIKPKEIVTQQTRPGEELDELDDSNVNSILAVADDGGNVHGFLDGSYRLGTIALGPTYTVSSLYKSGSTTLFSHYQVSASSGLQYNPLSPSIIHVPLLEQRVLRDVARSSTSIRELVWYTIRVVKDMRAAWFGSETNTGAREAGPKWIRSLEKRQKESFGQEEPSAMLDLTVLLTTGRASESLTDFLGSDELMSERGIQKWETSVSEALTKLRDYSAKRVAPACQRLHILLQELQGWSQLPQFTACQFQTQDIGTCLSLVERAIVCANWLAATARKELSRFRQFVAWLRYEVAKGANLTDSDRSAPPPKHDLLEVNEYLVSGLVVSAIDKWFMGPVPRFSTKDLGISIASDFNASIEAARQTLSDSRKLAWPPSIKHQDLSSLDRNLDSLMQDICTRCQRIFSEAANATARSATVSYGASSQTPPQSAVGGRKLSPIYIRERTVGDTSKAQYFLQYLALQTPHVGGRSYLCLVRMHHDKEASESPQAVSAAVLECSMADGDSDEPKSVEVVNAEFYDSETLIVVYRARDQEGRASVGMVGYGDLVYQDVSSDYVTREELMHALLRGIEEGEVDTEPLPVIDSCELIGCRSGGVSIAVNGRAGRRVVCVLDDEGYCLEILDTEGEVEEEEEEDDDDNEEDED